MQKREEYKMHYVSLNQQSHHGLKTVWDRGFFFHLLPLKNQSNHSRNWWQSEAGKKKENTLQLKQKINLLIAEMPTRYQVKLE